MDKTFIEFFAGIGLMRLGLEAHGWRGRWANDIDQKKLDMYYVAFRDRNVDYLTVDVNQLRGSEVPSALLATASFPCTDLSLAGARRGMAGSQSGSFWGFIRVLQEMDGRRPPLLLIENVPGLLSSHGGRDFQELIAALNRLRYSCDVFSLDAAHFLPQSRERIFVLGILDAPRTDPAVVLASRNDRLKNKHIWRFVQKHPQLDWSFRHLPPPPPRLKAGLASALEMLPDADPRWWPDDRTSYLVSQMSPRHLSIVEALMNRNSVTYGTVYRRVRHGKSRAELRCDDIAGCLRTPRGGSSRQIVLAMGRGRRRARFMTPREYGRLMGAADYPITVPDNQAYFGFGDAVAVPVVEWIAQNILNPITDEMVLGVDLATNRT